MLSGAPGMFSAGLDVPYLLTLDRDGIAAAWAGFYDLLRALADSPVPIAAAITGHSPAGGAVMAIFCDRRVMAEGRFAIGLNEVQVGIPLPPALYGALRRVVGQRTAERLAVAGAMLRADEAYRVGLVDELAPPEEVVGRAIGWCETLLELPRGPMLTTRERARRDLRAAGGAGRQGRGRGAGGRLVQRRNAGGADRHGGASEGEEEARRQGDEFMSELADKTCTPCRGGVPPLEGEALDRLAAQLGGGWQVIDGHHLDKEYRFPDFRQALEFTNRIGELAEEVNHHPNIFLTWGKVRVELWTHKIDGLNEADFVWAAKADRLVQ